MKKLSDATPTLVSYFEKLKTPFVFSELTSASVWEKVSDATKAWAVCQSQGLEKLPWPHSPVVGFIDFVTSGDRSAFEAISFEKRRRLLLLAFRIRVSAKTEDVSDFVRAAANGLWALCEESWWGVPAHFSHDGQHHILPNADQKNPYIDLFAAETASALAWVGTLIKPELDKLSPEIFLRIQSEINKRILEPFLARNDMWWMGLIPTKDHGGKVNNWNPWILSNILATAFLTEKDGKRVAAVVEKSLRCLDVYLNDMPKDGGCDEGPGYWNAAGAALFDALEILTEASAQAVDFSKHPKIAPIGKFIQTAHIAGTSFINFADGSPNNLISHHLISRYGKRVGDLDLYAFGRQWAEENQPLLPEVIPAWCIHRTLHLLTEELPKVETPADIQQDIYLPDLQWMVAREKKSLTSGLYLAAKGGHNQESHNHNDVGSFVLYLNGQPCVIDAGVETYTRHTFGPNRYQLWTMQSSWHNLPALVNESGFFEQMPGRTFSARDVSYRTESGNTFFSLDIAGAYPIESSLERYQRTFEMMRSGSPKIQLSESVLLGEAAHIEINFLLIEEPMALSEQVVRLKNRKGEELFLHLPAKTFEVSVEKKILTDEKIKADWKKDVLYRLRLRTLEKVQKSSWSFHFSQDSEK
jgi:hypothetical protein